MSGIHDFLKSLVFDFVRSIFSGSRNLLFAVRHELHCLVFGLLYWGATASAGQCPAVAQDPVLGLKYPVENVQFEAVPEEVFTACPELTNENWSRRGWVYAAVNEAGHRYFIIGGFYERREPKAGELRFEADTQGVFADISEAGCRLEGPARDVFDWRVNVLAPSLLDRLSADLAQRYGLAFGGMEKLRAAMAQQRVAIPKNSRALRKALGVQEELKVPVR